MLTAVMAWTRGRCLRHPAAANDGVRRRELTRLVLMTSALLALGVGCAQAGPCSADLAKIEKVLNEPNSPFGPTGRPDGRRPAWPAADAVVDGACRAESRVALPGRTHPGADAGQSEQSRLQEGGQRSSRRWLACNEAGHVTSPGRWVRPERAAIPRILANRSAIVSATTRPTRKVAPRGVAVNSGDNEVRVRISSPKSSSPKSSSPRSPPASEEPNENQQGPNPDDAHR